jgi:hypothetical protein
VPVPVPTVVAVAALILAILPLLWAGAVRQVFPATSTEMVERLVPTTVTYVGMSGLAMSVPFPAPGAAAERPPFGVLVRDTVASADMTIVTSGTDPRLLLARTVTGRMTPRPYGAAAAALLAARGEDTTGLDPVRVLIEVPAPDPDEPVTAAESVTDLVSVPDGTLVRVPLEFAGESTPTCVLAGACDRTVLAAGSAVFVQLAYGDGPDQALLVETAYPSSVVPGRWQGPQVRNGEELEDFAASAGVQALAGWSRILVQASIANDPDLIRDRLWLGPLLLTLLAGLLWLGGRIGYPFFRPVLEGSRRWTATPAADRPTRDTPTTAAPGEDLAIRVSGHALTVSGQRRHLDEEAAILRPASGSYEGRVTAAIDLADGAQIPLAAHDTGLLGRVERGEVVSLGGVRPALWAHWYGTDLRMTFESVAARDLAAGLVSRRGAPVRSGA